MHKHPYYRILGLVYGFTYWTNQHRLLGFRISTAVKALAFWPLLLAWQQNKRAITLGLALCLGVGVLWLYWWNGRVGYKKFVAVETAVSIQTPAELVEANRHIALKASGLFGVSDREEQLLLCPAEYWRVPRGEHTLMAQPKKGQFVYQFFSAATLQHIQKGWLIHGVTLRPALAVTFHSSWGAAPLSIRSLYQGGDTAVQNTKSRTVYLCFDNKNDEHVVWYTIMSDIQEKRKT